MTWLPCRRSFSQPALWKARTARSPETQEALPLHADLDLMNRDGQRHVIGPTRFQAAGDRLTNILQGLRLSGALRNASGGGRALGDDHAGFISIQCYEKL